MAVQKLTPEYVKRVREIFDIFDTEHNEDDEMSIDHMGLIIRAFGQIPTEAEVQEIIDEVDADGNRRLLFSELLDLLASLPPNERGNREELEQAFEIFKEREDKNVEGPNFGGEIGSGCMRGEEGYLSVAKLRRMLTFYGEVITDDMFDLLAKNCPKNMDGMIKTSQLIDVILDPTIKYTAEWLAMRDEPTVIVTD